MTRTTIIAAGSFLICHCVLAHHSDAALEMDAVLTFEGTVVEYTLRNPHAYFAVETEGFDGAPVIWEVQMASALSMSRRGWDQSTLSVGDQVRAGVRPARDGRSYGLYVFLEREGVPVSYERIDRPEVLTAAESIQGTWIVDRSSLGPDYPGGLAELADRDFVLTDAGQAAHDAFNQDSFDNPELSCITKPTPGGIIYTDIYPTQIEFVEDQDIAMIRVQYFDQERTVYLDGREHPPADQRTHEGHSIGWWEDDTFVVDTTNFADDRSPYQNGVPSGPLKHVVERYRLVNGGTHIEIEFMVEDPGYLVGSYSHTRQLFHAPHIPMTPFNCDMEATRRYLPG